MFRIKKIQCPNQKCYTKTEPLYPHIAYIFSIFQCIPLYWLIVSISGMGQSMILRHPRFKNFFGIPKLPTDSRTPVRDLLLMRRPQV